MRQVKFRAWDDSSMKMVRPRLVENESSNVIDERGFELMQYTGLRDMEDAEIYEGDIVQFTWWWFDGNEAESTLTGTVVYSGENMSFQLKGVKNKDWERHTGYENDCEYLTPFSELNFEGADFAVIGNIRQHPELLGA